MKQEGQALRTAAHNLIDLLDAGQLRMAVEFMGRLARGHAKDWGPLGTILGVEDGGRAVGASSCSLSVADIHSNPIGLAHGCFSFALSDFGMSYALKTMLKPEQWCTSQEVQIQFFRPVRRTHLLCCSQVVDISSDLAHVRSEVVNGSGQTVAKATGTYRVFESGRRSFQLVVKSEPQEDRFGTARQ